MDKSYLNQDLTAPSRNITRGHFSALRAWIQGVSLDLIAGRYLGYSQLDDEQPIPDARVIQGELQAMRDALIQRAYQHDRLDLVSALQRDIRYSDKGISRAIDAINVLEQLGTPRPALHNAVELWFAPALAKRLRAAELTTIKHLITCCNDRGHSWHSRVPRVGAKAAHVVVSWLKAHEESLGRSIGAHVTRALTLPAVELRRTPEVIDGRTLAVPPLEAMRLPTYCDGTNGENRGAKERCALEARNDYEAILSWLSLWPENSPTYRAYRKEAERFLAWAVIERAKAISSLKTEDCIAYRDFLADPQPRERWCAPMMSRSLPGWRPFQGPLSPSSQKYAQTVLKRFCEYLTRKHYLHLNPWDDVPTLKRGRTRIQTEKALPFDLWTQLWIWLNTKASNPKEKQIRLARAAIALLRDSGLRRIEACRATREQVIPLNEPDTEVFGELFVIGKRDKERFVPISRRTVNALREHWKDLDQDFDAATTGPLLQPLEMPKTQRARAKQERGELNFSESGLHNLIKNTMQLFAASLPPEDAMIAHRAARTRAHGFRHTFGVHAADNDVPIDVLQTILGHESMTTTTIYTQPGRKRRLRKIDKFFKA